MAQDHRLYVQKNIYSLKEIDRRYELYLNFCENNSSITKLEIDDHIYCSGYGNNIHQFVLPFSKNLRILKIFLCGYVGIMSIYRNFLKFTRKYIMSIMITKKIFLSK